MPPQKPSPEQIKQWIAGSLNTEDVRVVEHYFEQHPDELPHAEPPPLLKEASETASPEISELIESLKKQFSPQQSLPDIGDWLDLLTATKSSELLGRLGNLEIQEVISSTPMAIVLKAHDSEKERQLAIKILSPALASVPQARKRFLREARAMAKLEHEAILPVHDINDGPCPWFSMRYVAGGSLQDALDAEEPFLKTPDFIERLATKTAQALTAVHREGIIHRDIKPANILLSSDRSQIWVSDFGIAKVSDDPSLTIVQAVTGTPRYMSPEQANCAPLDSRSDVFSLGAVLYHCATGQAPFQGESSTQVLHQISSKNPQPLRNIRADLPSWLTQLINDCLAKKPSERPQLLVALQEKTARRELPLRHITTALIIVSCLALFTVLYFQNQKNKATDEPKNFIIATATGAQYSDLHEAILQSPPGEPIELEGNFLLEKKVITTPGAALHLRAASGKKARIIIRDTWTGFEVGGDLTLEGIQFEHYGKQGVQSTIITSGANTVSIKDCSFYSDAKKLNDPAGHWAITSRAVTKTTIERCTFQGQTMRAISLSDGKHFRPYRDGNLVMSDCLMDCPVGITLDCNNPHSKFQIQGEHTIFRGDKWIIHAEESKICPTHITLSDSIIDAKISLFLAFNTDPIFFRKSLTWVDRNNFYSSPERALVVTGQQATVEPLPSIKSPATTLFGKKQLLLENLPKDLISQAKGAFQRAPAPNPQFKYQRITLPTGKQRVSIDFGRASETTPSPDHLGRSWNNAPTANQQGPITLINNLGLQTKWSLEVIDDFHDVSTNSAGDETIYTDKATGDFAFVHKAENNKAKIRLSGLDSSKVYDLKFFASSSRPRRQKFITKYTVIGATMKHAWLEAIGNKDQVTSINGISPNKSGILSVTITPAMLSTYFGAIGVMELIERDPSSPATPDPDPF